MIRKNPQQPPRYLRNPSTKKRKREDFDSSIADFSEESTEARRPNKKYYILYGKWSHSTDNFKDLRAIISIHKWKKKKYFRNYGKSNKELNALIEKKFQKFVKNNKRMKTKKSFSTFKKCFSSLAESVDSGEISS